MKTRTLLAIGIAATAATLAAGAQAQTSRNLDLTGGKATHLNLNVFQVTCQVSGTPVEFPNDLVFTNVGKVSIPRWKAISWETSTPHHRNRFRLPHDLAPGASVRADNVLPGGMEAGRPCKARVM